MSRDGSRCGGGRDKECQVLGMVVDILGFVLGNSVRRGDGFGSKKLLIRELTVLEFLLISIVSKAVKVGL